MNQLPLVDSSACCDIANALVAGKLNPQQALARTSIWSALSRFASRDMSETYPGLLADRKQNKFACPSKCGAMRRRAGVAPRKNSTSFSRCNGDRVRMRQFLSERNLASTISKNQSCRVDSLSWRCRFWQYPRRSNRPACKGLRKLLDRSKRKMKALLKRETKPGLWLEEVPMPTIGINDVLIRVDRTGICGTDLHIYKWDEWARKTIPVPMVVGHEFVGEIAEVGSNVKDFFAGEVVSGEGHVVCGRCRNCLAGRRHLCAHTEGIGVNRPGAFADYLALPVTNVWHHDPSIDRDVAAIFDPFGNAVHTGLSFPVLGEDVLITGAGPVRIMAAAGVRHPRRPPAVITGGHPYWLRPAAQLGGAIVFGVRTGNLP